MMRIRIPLKYASKVNMLHRIPVSGLFEIKKAAL